MSSSTPTSSRIPAIPSPFIATDPQSLGGGTVLLQKIVLAGIANMVSPSFLRGYVVVFFNLNKCLIFFVVGSLYYKSFRSVRIILA